MAALLSTKSSCRLVAQLGYARIGTSAVANGAVSKIGNREVVGHGFNGEASYIDRADYPFPAVRFREPTAEFKV
jgi:cytochrome c oxidase subunit 4